MSAAGYLFGYILQGGQPLASSGNRPVTITILGMRAQNAQVAERGIRASASAVLGVGNPAVPGTMPRGETSDLGGFVVPFSVRGDQVAATFGLNASLLFRVAREARQSYGFTTQTREYEVRALAFPNLTGTQDYLNALTGRWQDFCGPALQGAGEAMVDEAAKLPILNIIRTGFERASVIADPDARLHILSVVRIRYPQQAR